MGSYIYYLFGLLDFRYYRYKVDNIISYWDFFECSLDFGAWY